MTIDEVIDKSIVAIFLDPELATRLVLKGGAAMRLLDGNATRISIDADFSMTDRIEDQNRFFSRMEDALRAMFRQSGYDVIDFTPTQRPKTLKAGFPKWWRGWLCLFKLVPLQFSNSSEQMKRRNAFIPKGATSPKITIEISEEEYCRAIRHRTIEGVRIHGYKRELLIVEKLRALCQQHKEYPFRSSKNRARDLYDIYQLSSGEDETMWAKCRKHVALVFQAKQVNEQLLNAFWEDDFVDELRRGFEQVVTTVKSQTYYDFDVYLEHTRYVVNQIRRTRK